LFDKTVCNSVGRCVVAPLNRDSERSLKLRSDNFCGCDLLPEDRLWAALADEAKPDGEQVSLVGFAFLPPRAAERLARGTTCPNRSVVGPSGEPEGNGPSADTGEEMALAIAFKVIRFYLRY